MAYSALQSPTIIRIPIVANVAIGANACFGTAIAPAAGQLHAAYWENGVNISLNATDYNVFTVQKAPSTNVLAITSMASFNTATTNIVLNTPTAFTLNTTVAAVRVNAGDFIQVHKNFVLNGTAGTANITGGFNLHFTFGSRDETSDAD
jgi:hypothetical protein